MKKEVKCRESFVFYRSFWEALRFTNSGLRLKVYDAICNYALEGAPLEQLPPAAKAFMTLICPQIEASTARHEAAVRGGYAKAAKYAKKNPAIAKQNTEKVSAMADENRLVNDNDNDNENENNNVNLNLNECAKRDRVISFEDIFNYCKERNSTVDPHEFYLHYHNRDWISGGSKIADWKALIRTWESYSGKKEEALF
jgi:hypothetical protein